jgi:hypothetical protein
MPGAWRAISMRFIRAISLRYRSRATPVSVRTNAIHEALKRRAAARSRISSQDSFMPHEVVISDSRQRWRSRFEQHANGFHRVSRTDEVIE